MVSDEWIILGRTTVRTLCQAMIGQLLARLALARLAIGASFNLCHFMKYSLVTGDCQNDVGPQLDNPPPSQGFRPQHRKYMEIPQANQENPPVSRPSQFLEASIFLQFQGMPAFLATIGLDHHLDQHWGGSINGGYPQIINFNGICP